MTKVVASVLVCVFISTAVSWAQAGDPRSTPPTGSGPAERVSVTAEALVWWMKDSPAPPPLASTGILGQPGTEVLLGGKDLNTGEHAGLRVTAAYWPREEWGLEASGFYLPSRSTTRSVSSSGEVGSRDLFIPFFDVTVPGENVTGLSSAGRFSGQATEELRTRLLGAELNGALKLASNAAWRLDLLGGFRYLNLRETFAFTTNSPDIPPGPVDIFQTNDQFKTTNDFYGGQVGVRARHDRGPWTVGGTVKVALGALTQSVEIDGFLFTNDFSDLGDPERFPGGYFAQPTNMGRHGRTVFAVVPEIGLNVEYRLTDWITLLLGYTFLFASDVVRPGDQIDRGINPTQNASFGGAPPTPLVGLVRPAFRHHGSDFWAQGLNVGFAVRF
jgi:hypothetical protein